MNELVDQIEILENEIICLIDEVEVGQFDGHVPTDGRKRRLNALRPQLENLKKLFDERFGNTSSYLI